MCFHCMIWCVFCTSHFKWMVCSLNSKYYCVFFISSQTQDTDALFAFCNSPFSIFLLTICDWFVFNCLHINTTCTVFSVHNRMFMHVECGTSYTLMNGMKWKFESKLFTQRTRHPSNPECSGIAKRHICSKLKESIEHKQLIFFFIGHNIMNCKNIRPSKGAERDGKNGTM